MARRIVLLAALVACGAGMGGCTFSLNYDENVRYINHVGNSLHEIRILTNKYWFDYDQENPFEGG